MSAIVVAVGITMSVLLVPVGDSSPGVGVTSSDSAAHWRTLPAAPFRLSDALSAWTGSDAILVGGLVDASAPASQRVLAWNADTREWRRLGDVPRPVAAVAKGLSGPPHAVVDDQLYVFGVGRTGAAAVDPDTGNWRTLERPPSGYDARDLGATQAVFTGREILLWGYAGSSRPIALSYDPARNSWRSFDPGPLTYRMGPVVEWVDGRMLVWGGTDGSFPGTSDGASYDPRAGVWRGMAPSPLDERWFTMAGRTSGGLVVVGGSVVSPLADAAVYDVRTDTWRSLQDFPTPVSSLTSEIARVDGGTVVVAGDADTSWVRFLPDGATAWRELPPLPKPRCGEALVSVPEGLLVWGGRTCGDFNARTRFFNAPLLLEDPSE